LLKISKGLFPCKKNNFKRQLNEETKMTEDEVVEIVKESNLWESLTQTEKEEAIHHALKITGTSMDRESTD